MRESIKSSKFSFSSKEFYFVDLDRQNSYHLIFLSDECGPFPRSSEIWNGRYAITTRKKEETTACRVWIWLLLLIWQFSNPVFNICQLQLFRCLRNKTQIAGICPLTVKRLPLNHAYDKCFSIKLFSTWNATFEPKDWMQIRNQLGPRKYGATGFAHLTSFFLNPEWTIRNNWISYSHLSPATYNYMTHCSSNKDPTGTPKNCFPIRQI